MTTLLKQRSGFGSRLRVFVHPTPPGRGATLPQVGRVSRAHRPHSLLEGRDGGGQRGGASRELRLGLQEGTGLGQSQGRCLGQLCENQEEALPQGSKALHRIRD